MTRFEAAQALKTGNVKLTHMYFTPEEWVMGIGDGKYLLEDGVICSAAEFWKWRQQEFFNDGWEIFNE
jgi:predicted choloylglycine hydrolase